MDEPWYRWDGDDLLLAVRVQPRASRDEIVGPHGDSLKVRITAPPVEGRANAYLIRFLAKAFGVARGEVALESGEIGRTKRVRVRCPSTLPEQAQIAPRSGARM